MGFSIVLGAADRLPDSTAKNDAVLALVAAWDLAYIQKDAAPLERLLAVDYLGIDDEGAVTSKADEIALIKSGEYVLHSVDEIEPAKVRFYGDTAVVTTHAKVKQTYQGETKTVDGRATTVCVERGGRWQIVSWHASRLKAK